MTCAEILKLLPERSLGDLDAEPAAEVDAHLRSCGACRAEEAAIGRTVSLLKKAPLLSPSTERRSIAVAAMSAAQADRAERLLAPRRPAWTPWLTAAAFLLAFAAALSTRSAGPVFRVTQVAGRVEMLDRGSGLWRSVAAGDAVGVGDRLLTPIGASARLQAGRTELLLDQDTSIDVVAFRRVTLDRGRLLAQAAGPETLIVTDASNNSASVSAGRVELALRDVTRMVGGSLERRDQPAILPETRTTEVSRRLVARVLDGEAALNGSKEQRLRAAAGQEGTFDFGGQPATAAMGEGARAGSWAEPGRKN